MRRFFGFLLTMALLGGGVFWLPYLQAEPVDNVYQAADLLRQDAEDGGNGVAFREDNVDADEVYRALEAQYPYAFALHAVTRPNKTIELNAEVSRTIPSSASASTMWIRQRRTLRTARHPLLRQTARCSIIRPCAPVTAARMRCCARRQAFRSSMSHPRK